MNHEKYIAKRVKNIEISKIRYFSNTDDEVEGVVSLCMGEPDFSTPVQVCETAIKAIMESKTFYTVSAGELKLREEISKYLFRRFNLKYDPENEIMVTVGTSEAINVAIRTLVEPGDEVLIPAPSFAAYGPCTVLAAGKPVYVPIYEEDDFILRPDVLEKHITKKSKVLILPYPNNPTGAVMNRKQMEDIAIIVEENDLIVITDETYCELTYDVSHIPFATLPSMWDRTITINGLSQSYAMTGWRIGYIGAPSAMIAQMLKVHQYNVTCAAAMAQYAAINALETGDEDIEFMRETYNERRRFLISSLEEMGLKCFKPKGAFYAFPSIKNTGLSSEEFTKRLLLEAKVAVMPGNAFGENGQGYVRLAYATSMVDLEVAVGRMKKFMKNYLCKK